jgi:hypothetical protein
MISSDFCGVPSQSWSRISAFSACGLMMKNLPPASPVFSVPT